MSSDPEPRVLHTTGQGVPRLHLASAGGIYTAPPVPDRLLLDLARCAGVATQLRATAVEARRDAGVRADVTGLPDLVVIAGALRPWAAPALDGGHTLPPRVSTPESLYTVLGARTLREAAAQLTGRRPSRLVVRALAERTVNEDFPQPIEIAGLSVIRLGATLGLSDEQVATLLRVQRPVHVPSNDAGPEHALDGWEQDALRDRLVGSDPAVLTRLLADMLGDDEAWAGMIDVANVHTGEPPLPVPARGSVASWLTAITCRELYGHGDRPATGVDGAQVVDAAVTRDGATVRLAHTVQDVVDVGSEFSNCLRSSWRAYTEAPVQVFTVHDRAGSPVAVGHLVASSGGSLHVDTLLGVRNQPVPAHVAQDVHQLVFTSGGPTCQRSRIRVEHAAAVQLLAELLDEVDDGRPMLDAVEAFVDAATDGTIALPAEQRARLNDLIDPVTDRVLMDADLQHLELPGGRHRWPVAAAALLWAAGHPDIRTLPGRRDDVEHVREDVERALARRSVDPAAALSGEAIKGELRAPDGGAVRCGVVVDTLLWYVAS